jgi:hypothetical protein
MGGSQHEVIDFPVGGGFDIYWRAGLGATTKAAADTQATSHTGSAGS